MSPIIEMRKQFIEASDKKYEVATRRVITLEAELVQAKLMRTAAARECCDWKEGIVGIPSVAEEPITPTPDDLGLVEAINAKRYDDFMRRQDNERFPPKK